MRWGVGDRESLTGDRLELRTGERELREADRQVVRVFLVDDPLGQLLRLSFAWICSGLGLLLLRLFRGFLVDLFVWGLSSDCCSLLLWGVSLKL